MVDFVLSMNNPKCSNEKRIQLLNRMEMKHTNLYKDAMNGKGIDRHLFALYVACKGLGQVSYTGFWMSKELKLTLKTNQKFNQKLQESEFLQNVLTMPWTLSTSQTPHTQQTAVPDPNWMSFNNKVSHDNLLDCLEMK